MGAAIGDVLGLAAGVAVSPLPIVAMILVLATPRGRANGSLFGLGWLAGLSILGAVVLLLAGPAGASDEGEPAAWTGWLKLLLGVLALLLAARQWRARPAPGEAPEMPKWMAGLDKLKPGGALGLGALLSGVNPKNAALTIAAAATIAGAGLPGGEQAVTLAVFVVIGSSRDWFHRCTCSADRLSCRRGARGQDPRHLEDVGRRPQRRRHGRAVRGIRIQACR
jgi:threonine/homoserine/homoserine lactone efflux protein